MESEENKKEVRDEAMIVPETAEQSDAVELGNTAEITGSFVPPEITDSLEHVVEALLFASDEPLNASKLKDILGVHLDGREFRRIVNDINRKLQSERRPFEVSEVAGGFQYRTIRAYQKYIKALFKDRAMRRLSGQALETLAIIAYKQPVSKAEIEGIRNVSTDSALKTLLEKRLILILGKSEEKPGKPIVYGTTKDFLKYFGLSKISDLPKLEEMEEIAKGHEKSELIHDFKRDTEKTRTLSDKEAVSESAPTFEETPEATVPVEETAPVQENDISLPVETDEEEPRSGEPIA